MEVSISIPLDGDGFIRRTCPKCTTEFKWHIGRTDETPADWDDTPAYWCPICGEASPNDEFLTEAQAEFIKESMAGPALDMIGDAFEDAFRGSKSITMKRGNRSDYPEPPTPLTEPDDMLQIKSPCHPREPVKVSEDSIAPYHCLVCGEAFAV